MDMHKQQINVRSIFDAFTLHQSGKDLKLECQETSELNLLKV